MIKGRPCKCLGMPGTSTEQSLWIPWNGSKWLVSHFDRRQLGIGTELVKLSLQLLKWNHGTVVEYSLHTMSWLLCQNWSSTIFSKWRWSLPRNSLSVWWHWTQATRKHLPPLVSKATLDQGSANFESNPLYSRIQFCLIMCQLISINCFWTCKIIWFKFDTC